MTDIPLSSALLLWDSGLHGEPRFAVRPLGHPDYDRYQYKLGACFRDWQELTSADPSKLQLRAMVDLWHAVAFYAVPAELVNEAMLVVPEYRDMLADDCLPKQFRHERE